MEYSAHHAQQRAHGLDELRGLAILLMVAHHAAWDLEHLFGMAVPLLHSPLVEALRELFAGLFVFLSGMVCNVSRSNLRRGLLTLGCALGVTAVTALALPGRTVWFGILHLLGSCMALYGLGERLLERIPPGAGAAVSVLGFAVLRRLPGGELLLGPLRLQLPAGWYRLPLGFAVGLPSPDFASGDYFPLIPWAFVFLAGSFAGRPVFARRRPDWLFRSHLPGLAGVGRRTLWIYLLHQPVIYGLLWLLLGP